MKTFEEFISQAAEHGGVNLIFEAGMYSLANDPDRAAKAAEPLGYRAKKMMGGYTLIRPEQDLAEAVHLMFVGEKSKSTQPLPHPEIHPEPRSLG